MTLVPPSRDVLPFQIAHATADDWANAAKACTDRLTPVEDGRALGFVYVTDHFAEDFASILTYLRQKTRIEHWVGSVGVAVFAETREFFDVPAVSVMVAPFDAETFRVFPSITEGADQLGPALLSWIATHGAPFALVHGDPSNPDTPELIDDLAEATTGFLVGGMTSSRYGNHQVAGRITGGGVSGVLFSPAVAVATGLSQGCMPAGPSRVVSDCLDNVLIGLDGKRAIEAFREDFGDAAAQDPTTLAGEVHVALPIEGSDTGDYLVRNLVGVDPVRGWLAIAGLVDPGERVFFVRRDSHTALVDLKQMVESVARRLDRPPRGALFISCLARGINLFDQPGIELAVIREVLGPVPLVGFAASGEISNARQHSYTGVLTLFL